MRWPNGKHMNSCKMSYKTFERSYRSTRIAFPRPPTVPLRAPPEVEKHPEIALGEHAEMPTVHRPLVSSVATTA